MAVLTTALHVTVFRDLGWIGLIISAGLVGELLLEVWLSCRVHFESRGIRIRWAWHESIIELSGLEVRRKEKMLTLVTSKGEVFQIRPQWWRRRKLEILSDLESELRRVG